MLREEREVTVVTKGAAHPDSIGAAVNMAAVLARLGQHAEAHTLLEEAKVALTPMAEEQPRLMGIITSNMQALANMMASSSQAGSAAGGAAGDPRAVFATQLAALASMGLGDDEERNVAVLMQTGGDIEAAMALLFDQ